jgi:putative nucleotidyltransferase with HDIG domain
MDPISKLIEKIDTLPASPALLPKLTQALNDIDNTDVHEIVDIIVFDSALTAKLLQISNSAFFGSRQSITSVGEAISQIGYETVFLLAATISGSNVLRAAPGTGLDSVLLWKHSVTTAFGAQHVAQAAGLDGNLAFTPGLLHDLGKVVFAETYGKSYTLMFDPAKRGSVSLVDWEMEHYGCNHADVGATLLESWKLPKPLVAGVKYHHKPSAAGEHARLAACISLGNALSRTLENPKFEVDKTNPEIEPALKVAKLTVDDLDKQWHRIRDKWEFVQTLYDLRK